MVNLMVDEVLNTEATFKSGGETYQLISELGEAEKEEHFRYRALVTAIDGTTSIKPVYRMDIPQGFQTTICKFKNHGWFKRGDVVHVERKTPDAILQFDAIVVACTTDGISLTYYDEQGEVTKQMLTPDYVLQKNIVIVKYDELKKV